MTARVSNQSENPPSDFVTLYNKEDNCCPLCLKRLKGGMKPVVQCIKCENGVHYECGMTLFKDMKKQMNRWTCDMCRVKTPIKDSLGRKVERRCILCKQGDKSANGLFKECDHLLDGNGIQFIHLRC
jgi:hypothetical protein